MSQDIASDVEATEIPRKRPLFRWFMLLLLLLAVSASVYAWFSREEIARDLITSELDALGVEASYDIVRIGASDQYLSNIVIGDPDQPDLTIDRLSLRIQPRFGVPSINDLNVEGARLFGTIQDGVLSFGALDPLLESEDDAAPFEFPDMELTLSDARVLIEGDYGPVAMTLSGDGHLRGGFNGELAAVAPALVLPGCEVSRATMFGELGIDAERPQFSGPLRFENLACEEAAIIVAGGDIEVELHADRNLRDFEGDVVLQLGASDITEVHLEGFSGGSHFTYRGGDMTAGFTIEGEGVDATVAGVSHLQFEGWVRAQDEFARVEIHSELAADQVELGPQALRQLADARTSSDGTLFAPLLERLQTSLTSEMRGSHFVANITARHEEERTSLLIPEARLSGRSGSSIFSLSRGQFAFAADEPLHFSGNFATGGRGLPQISGRMERGGDGPLDLRMRMAEYRAEEASLAVPDLRLLYSTNGQSRFTGNLLASGGLPGGTISGLALPLNGNISPAGNVSMWSECTNIAFDALEMSGVMLNEEELRFCSGKDQPILRYDNSGIALDVRIDQLNLIGQMEGSPIRMVSGPAMVSFPGALSANDVVIELGTGEELSRFVLGNVSGELGEAISGRFAQGDFRLAALPLNITNASGNWEFDDGRLQLSNGRFMLSDREEDERFETLITRGARLAYADNRIASSFLLREPSSDSAVTQVNLTHDLNTGEGGAQLDVNDLTFALNGMQPADLTDMMYGVISLVDGSISGTGQIAWDASNISSSGEFSSDGLDLAAAFGQVEGARGTVIFTDLLGLTTAPSQRLSIDTINPGIEVYDGSLLFSLRDGSTLLLENAAWPFLGGQLTMQPVTMQIGIAEERRYVFQIVGLEASQFVERMELNNLSGSGRFDGTIPVIFDAEGNGRLEGGVLRVQPPGGHLSYVGQLTYEDLSAVGNFAFQSLRDLQYDEMEVFMDGPLTGELVTRVRFDRIRQGETADTNIVTRQIAKLPIQLNVNITAPFYQLMRTMSALYDPSSVRDPRGLGLMRDDGTRLLERMNQQDVDERDSLLQTEIESEQIDESDIQPHESEAMP